MPKLLCRGKLFFVLCSLQIGTCLAIQTSARHFRQVDLEKTAETSANASVGDLDGDGDLDIVLAKGRHWPLHDRVLLNDGEGGFPVAKNLGPSADRTYSAVLADLDGDGGEFTEGLQLGDKSLAPYAIAVDDMNRDGQPDIVVGYVKSPGSIFLSDGTGMNFEQVRFGDGLGSVYGLTLGDLDADGFLDIVAARSEAPNAVYLNVK